MKNFAVLHDNIVRNIIIADSLEDAESITGLTCVEYKQDQIVGIDFLYEDGAFVNPVQEEIVELSEEKRRELFIAYGLDPDNPPPPNIIEGEIVPPAIEG